MNPGEGRDWIAVADWADLTPGLGVEVTRHGQTVALFRVEERVFALGGRCPHQRAPLAGGLVDLAGSTVTCPRRGCLRWRFNLATGTHAAGLAVTCPTYPVEVRAGVVRVAFPVAGDRSA